MVIECLTENYFSDFYKFKNYSLHRINYEVNDQKAVFDGWLKVQWQYSLHATLSIDLVHYTHQDNVVKLDRTQYLDSEESLNYTFAFLQLYQKKFETY